jgi:hypothetical protein
MLNLKKIISFLFFLLFAISILLSKSYNLDYNSPFNDEAVYVVVGKMGLFNGDWESLTPFNWVGGVPFVYPLISGGLYALGGIELARLFNVVLFMLSLYFVYQIAYHLAESDQRLARNGALIAVLGLGFSQSGYYVSRLATYDMPSFFLIIVAFYFMVAASKPFLFPGQYYFLSSMFALLSFFMKYSTGIFIPIIALLSFLLIDKKNKDKKKAWFIYQVLPIVIALSSFVWLRHQSLTIFYQEQMQGITSDLTTILRVIWTETRYSLILMIPGTIGLMIARKFKLLLTILTISAALIVIHLQSLRVATLDKHLFMSAAGFCLIGGLGIAELYQRAKSPKIQPLFKIAIIFTLILFTHFSSSAYSKYNQMWTNTHPVHQSVYTMVNGEAVVLTQLGASSQLALFSKTPVSKVHTFDWVYYDGVSQEKALVKGIDDGYFDVIILEKDNPFYTSYHQRMHQLAQETIDGAYQLNYEDNNFLVYQRIY